MTALPSSRSRPAREARPIAGRAPGLPWSVMQRIDHPDAKAANAQILDDLNNGANGITLVFEGAVGDHGYALAASGTAISAALDEVYLDAGIAVDLDLGLQSKDAAGLLATLVKARAIAPQGRRPSASASTRSAPSLWPGRAPSPGKTSPHSLPRSSPISRAKVSPDRLPPPTGRVIHAAGGSEAQELAFALASAHCLSPRT